MATFVLLLVADSHAYKLYQQQAVEQMPEPSVSAPAREVAVPPRQSMYSCDGRTHCSQMTSCAEARFFLANCPGTAMDGNNDGEPCEQQWCTSSRAQ